jgi:hypothetical protein
MLKISLEMSDDSEVCGSVKAEIIESAINQHSICNEVVYVIPRLLMAAGWFPESIFQAMEEWVEENRCIYVEEEKE